MQILRTARSLKKAPRSRPRRFEVIQPMVEAELERRFRIKATYEALEDPTPPKLLVHSILYQGRGSMPSNFDCNLGETS